MVDCTVWYRHSSPCFSNSGSQLAEGGKVMGYYKAFNDVGTRFQLLGETIIQAFHVDYCSFGISKILAAFKRRVGLPILSLG